MEENYRNLSLNQKRNELNKITLKLLYLINMIVDDPKKDYYNYPENEKEISEEEFLVEEYLQIKESLDKLLNIFS